MLHTFATFPQTTSGTLIATTIAILTTVTLLYLFRKTKSGKLTEQDKKLPPHIPSPVPYLGHAVDFARNPIDFLLKAYKEYGSVFSFTMVGKTFTYVIGPRPCAVFFNSKNDDVNAEEAYTKLITPMVGKGVGFDVPNKVMNEQKRWMKSSLTVAHFRRYVPLIEKEATDYFERWGESGERDLYLALSELFIFTASRCLHGKEIREQLHENVAQLYKDIEGGFSHLAWLLPRWLPLPSFRKRDKARLEVCKIFGEVIRKCRESSCEECESSYLNTLIHATYKNGRQPLDDEIAGMVIGTLLAGQHNTSTTSSWLGFFLAREKQLQAQAYAEQISVRGEEFLPLEYDQLKNMEFLDRCLKETLRIRPPAMTLLRMVKAPQVIEGFNIPTGHQLCVSPTVNQRLEEFWDDPEHFNPNRFLNTSNAGCEKFAYVPFGAGGHRCVGEAFSYLQIKTIWSVLLQKYEFDLVDGHFPSVNYSTIIHTPIKPIIKYKRRQKISVN